MKRIIYICCLLFITWPQMEGQSLQVSGSKIDLPSGGILGAAFYEDKGMLFVQQSVSSTENDRSDTDYYRQLSSWDLSSHAMISKRVVDSIRMGAKATPCGRVQVSATAHRVYVCNAESGLEIIDPDTLETAGTMAHVDGQTIIDFAVDDLNGRALVLSAQKDKSILLTSYSLLTGEKQQETTLPTINYFAGVGVPHDLVSVSPAGQIGVYLQDLSGSLIRNNSGIYMCKYAPKLTCLKTSDADLTTWLAEIDFLGQDILAVSSKFQDPKSACIVSVSSGYKYSIKNPLWLGASQKYCTRHGVHYAVGVVQDKYVVGFTGVSSYNRFTENLKVVSNSSSVWRAGTYNSIWSVGFSKSKVAAVMKVPTDIGFQSAFRIVGSNTKPLFIAYHGLSNTLFLYSITDH